MTAPLSRSTLRKPPVGSSKARAAKIEHSPLLDQTHINQICAVIGRPRFDGLLELLVKELAERPARIRRAVLAGDVSRARHESHSFKGATTSVGAMALGEAAAAIERAPDLAAMTVALAVLDAEAMRTRHAIANMLPGSRMI